MKHRNYLIILLTLVVLGCVWRADAQQNLAQQAHAIFEQHCVSCHGPNRAFAEILTIQHDALIASGHVVASEPDDSELYQRLLGDTPNGPRMPILAPPLPAAAIDTIRLWIEAGAPNWEVAPTQRVFITTDAMLATIQQHVESLAPLDRPFARYFTLTHLYNAGETNEALRDYRQALAKLINSLSWEYQVIRPQPIDKEETLYYIDLRDYKWDVNEAWLKMEGVYPYGFNYGIEGYATLQQNTNCLVPFVHVDWFLATASLPPLYHDILDLPQTDRELEARLEVNVARNLKNAPGVRVWRAGFNESRVSSNNRVVERHRSRYGAYWKSYDFAGNVARQNIFTHPLSFKHDGSEIIFNLPNGLQAYYISNAAGRRLDAAPVDIVSNPAARDPVVRNGLSCIGCHTEGMKQFDDGVREVIQHTANPTYNKAQALRLYIEKATMDALLREDTQRFKEALEAAGGIFGGAEPVERLQQQFESPLDAAHAAAALGMITPDFRKEIQEGKLQTLGLQGLLLTDGSVQRDTWTSQFQSVVSALSAENRLYTGTRGLPPAAAQDYSRWGLPEGPTRRFGKGGITEIAYSPDGSLFAVASSIGVWLYDADTTQEVALLTGHTDIVTSVSFSPSGLTLASGSRDDTIRLWDANTGALRQTLTDHTGDVTSIDFSPDGLTLASGSHDGTVILWNLTTGEASNTLHTGDVTSIDFSPDGLTLASGRQNIDLWDVVTGEHQKTLAGHADRVLSISFSSDGLTLASGSQDHTIRLWDITTGAELRRFGHSHVLSVRFSSDGLTLASGGGDDTIRLWDAPTGTLLKTLTGHIGDVLSVCFSSDGQMLASGSHDGTIRLWDFATVWDAASGEPRQILSEHTQFVSSVSFSSDGLTLASGNGRNIDLWDVATGTHRNTLKGHTEDVLSVCFSSDGLTLASGSRDGTIRLWDVTTSEQRHSFGHGGAVNSVYLSGDGQMLASGSSDQRILLWDITTGENRQAFSHNDVVNSVCFSSDGQMLASGSADRTIRLWDVTTGELRKTLSRHTSSVESVCFSPDGSTLASGSQDNTIRLWDVITGALQKTFTGHTNGVFSTSFSSDGLTLASGSQDNTIRLWNVTTGKLRRTLTGHTDGVLSVSFSGDGRALASGSSDGLVFLWNIAPTGESIGAPHLAMDVNQGGTVNISKTSLFPNYPNPFNPETWIPYQLATPTAVTISIHAADGKLVRTLALGHQLAGIYRSRSRAAYWDGRNEVGERAASGVYFYTLTANNFSATGKMLIRK